MNFSTLATTDYTVKSILDVLIELKKHAPWCDLWKNKDKNGCTPLVLPLRGILKITGE